MGVDEASRLKAELEGKGFRVQVVDEQATPITPLITQARLWCRSFMQDAKGGTADLEKTTKENVVEGIGTASQMFDEGLQVARQNPEATLAGITAAVVVSSLFTRSFTLAMRNITMGGLTAGAILNPEELSDTAHEIAGKVGPVLKDKLSSSFKV